MHFLELSAKYRINFRKKQDLILDVGILTLTFLNGAKVLHRGLHLFALICNGTLVTVHFAHELLAVCHGLVHFLKTIEA